jgi:SAM-dependent methyltransferase
MLASWLDFAVLEGYYRLDMRQELLESVICPACEHGSWRLEDEQSSATGIIQRGLLVCTTCGAQYTISDGVVDLLPQPDEVILRERAGWEEFLRGAPEELDDAWLLALPHIDEGVTSNVESIAHWKRQADNFENLIHQLELCGRERVLELGAGRCWASAYLARRGCQVVALDVVKAENAGGLEAGRAYLDHGTPYFDRVVASMEKLPFRRETFDLILSVASIHHTALLDQVVSECGRVLKLGGKLALTSEPCIRILKERRVHNLETEMGINEHVYNLLDYRRAFGKAGLRAGYYLPGALVAMLGGEGLGVKAGRFEEWLFGLTRWMWGKEAIRRLLRSQSANLMGLLFLEYGLTAIAEKKREAKGQ